MVLPKIYPVKHCTVNGFFVGDSSWASTKYVACSFHSVCCQIDRYDNSCNDNGLYLSDDTYNVEQSKCAIEWKRDSIMVLQHGSFQLPAKLVYFDVEKNIALLEIVRRSNYESKYFLQVGDFDVDAQNVISMGMLIAKIAKVTLFA